MFDIIKTDYARSTKRKWSIVNYLLLCFSSKGVAAVKDYRFSNWLYRKNFLFRQRWFKIEILKSMAAILDVVHK